MDALIGARLHTPEGILSGRALLFADGVIRDIVAEDAMPAGAQVTRLAGGTFAAGFIDLQVNGGGGMMFNDVPTTATIAAIGRAHRPFGTTGFLPTFISGPRADMGRAVRGGCGRRSIRGCRGSSASTSKVPTSTWRGVEPMMRAKSGRWGTMTSTLLAITGCRANPRDAGA